jgi:hypothetical protein
MISGLPYDCRLEGSRAAPANATFESLAMLAGLKERKRPEDQEWDDFHVRKDPSVSHHNVGDSLSPADYTTAVKGA